MGTRFVDPMRALAVGLRALDPPPLPLLRHSATALDLAPLADRRLGGVIMWVPARLNPLVAFTVVFFRWVAAEADEEPSAVSP